MNGLFVGLTTLDLIQYVQEFPKPDMKIQALDSWMGAGGPAANAAITFASLGGRAQLVTALGNSPAAQIARDDLESHGVTVRDVARAGRLAASSIVVDERGRRTVVSVSGADFKPPFDDMRVGGEVAVVLADGHHAAVAMPLLDQAFDADVPIILDGGSVKPETERLLSRSRYVIISAAFAAGEPPAMLLQRLLRPPVQLAAMSQGSGPIVGATRAGAFEIEVSAVEAIDTLGAGDVLHGAFAYHLQAAPDDPIGALSRAASVASTSCTRRGPRII